MTRTCVVWPVAIGVALAGCSLIGGISDRYEAPTAKDEGTGGSAGRTSTGGSSGASGISGSSGHCSASTNTDPKNCGRCGHDCIGGQCQSGQCQPITLYSANNANCTKIAINSKTVFWIQYYPQPMLIMAVPKAGGIARPVGASLNTNAALSLAADDQNVYWTEETGGDGGPCTGNPSNCDLAVMKMPVSGGTAQQIATVQPGASTPSGIAVDATNVYFGDYYLGVMKVCSIGCA